MSWHHPSFLDEKMDRAKSKQGNPRRKIMINKLK
jgi:hypothetical protein